MALNGQVLHANDQSLEPRKSKHASNPPPPTPAKSSHNQQSNPANSNEHTTEDKRGTEEQPLVIKSVETPSAAAIRDYERSKRDDEASTNWWIMVWTAVAAGGSIATAFVAGRAAKIAIRTLESAEKQAAAALDTARHLTTAERGYLKISHRPPGLVFHEAGLCDVHIDIKNIGRTPVRITDAFGKTVLNHWADPLPAPLDTPDTETRRAFLQTNDTFDFFIPNLPLLDESGVAQLKNGSMRLVVLALVDYIDQFDVRHRSWYAAEYRHMMDWPTTYGTEELPETRDNLVLIMRSGYNDDRPRNKGEGNDWNNPI